MQINGIWDLMGYNANWIFIFNELNIIIQCYKCSESSQYDVKSKRRFIFIYCINNVLFPAKSIFAKICMASQLS